MAKNKSNNTDWIKRIKVPALIIYIVIMIMLGLRKMGYISSWWIITAPLWFPLGVILSIYLIMIVAASLIDDKK